jgi:hypothetical protein
MNKTAKTIRTVALAAIAAGAICPTAATAADVVFPNADASGNLMSATAWGGTVPTTDRPKITKGGTYYADPNGTLAGINIGTTGRVVFDMKKSTQAEPTITMGANFDVSGVGHNVNVEFVGGTWDFQGSYRIDKGQWGAYYGNTVRLDGCNMTNMTHIGFTYAANGQAPTEWTLDNGSTLHANGNFKPDNDGRSAVHVNVNGGSRILVGDYMMLGYSSGNISASQTADQTVIVSGTGSLLRFGKSNNVSYVGEKFCNTLLEARDGGEINRVAGDFVIGGGAYATNNVVRAVGTGSVATLGNLIFGYSGAASGNRVEALDGAEVTASYVTFSKGRDNGFACSNATITIRQFVQGANVTNSFVHVQGNAPKVILSQSGVTQPNNLKQGFRLIFDLPPDGYAYANAGDCPIVAYSTQPNSGFDATSAIEINGIKEYKAGMARRGVRKERVKLAYIDTSDYYGLSDIDAIIAGWNATMPEGATLCTTGRNSADRNRSIYLEVKLDSPTVLSFR